MSRNTLYFLLLLYLVAGERVKRQFNNYCFPRLQPPRNGYFTFQCLNMLGSSCTIACLPGTILIGESRLTCLPDTRTWNAPLPLCVPNPATGTGVSPQVPGSTGIMYPGSGQQGIVIGPAVGIMPGTVISPGGTSIQIVCPALSPPLNGIRSGNCDRAGPGTVCLFSCLPGYSLSGYPILSCGSNGQWTPQVPPSCLTQMPVYPPVYPGMPGMLGGGGGGGGSLPVMTTPRTQVMMTTMIPAMLIPMTTPRPVTCPPLISPPNGMAQGACTNAMPNSQPCFFSCFRGFVLSGFPVLTCLTGGRWSSPPPACRGCSGTRPGTGRPQALSALQSYSCRRRSPLSWRGYPFLFG